MSTQGTVQERAKDLCERELEMLISSLVGHLKHFGSVHVIKALVQANVIIDDWREKHAPHHVPDFLRLKALAETPAPAKPEAEG